MTTKEEIQKSINSRLTTLPTKTEGGTIQDIIGSVSYELANITDTRIDVILDNAFVTTADEEHLIIKGEELGITKKEAISAYVVAKITGAEPDLQTTSVIMAKTKEEILFKTYKEIKTDSNGEAFVEMEALSKGSIGNIEPYTLNEFVEIYQGFENAEITNPSKGYNGFDNEDIEEYRQRILDYMRDDACNSNISDYIMWAKSVTGVKNVVAEDANKAGAGKVNVYISASNNAEVTDELIKSVEEKIKKEQIINAKVSVLPLEYLEINISADLTIKDGYEIDSLKEKFSRILDDYLSSNPNLVSYLFISNLLFETEGIEDVSNYLLNGSASSITVNALQIPVRGEIEFNAEQGD